MADTLILSESGCGFMWLVLRPKVRVESAVCADHCRFCLSIFTVYPAALKGYRARCIEDSVSGLVELRPPPPSVCPCGVVSGSKGTAL